MSRQLSLIGAPTDIGAGTRGASMGPEALRVANILTVLESHGLQVVDRGNLVGPANPWSATGLEWQTPSPPTVHNFDQKPIVVCGPYEYAIGVDQMGRGLPEPPGTVEDASTKGVQTGPTGPQKKETEVVG